MYTKQTLSSDTNVKRKVLLQVAETSQDFESLYKK